MEITRFATGDIDVSERLNLMIDTIDQNETDIVAIKKKIFPMTATVSISPTGYREKGSGSVNVTISWANAKVDNQPVSITKVTINGEEVNAAAGSVVRSVSDTTSFAVVVYAAGMSDSHSVGITYVYPTYIFFSVESNYQNVTLDGTKQLLGNATMNNKSVTNNAATDAYLWICTPYNVSSVKTSGGLEIGVAGSIRGTRNNLKYWRSNDALAPGTWIFNVK